MIPKLIILVMAALNGGWMLFDGMHVLQKGKFFGPKEPGLWSNFFSVIGINPFKLGPLFIFFGAAWLICGIGIYFTISWAWFALMFLAIFTLWYVKIGTAISLIVIFTLSLFKTSIGYV